PRICTKKHRPSTRCSCPVSLLFYRLYGWHRTGMLLHIARIRSIFPLLSLYQPLNNPPAYYIQPPPAGNRIDISLSTSFLACSSASSTISSLLTSLTGTKVSITCVGEPFSPQRVLSAPTSAAVQTVTTAYLAPIMFLSDGSLGS